MQTKETIVDRIVRMELYFDTISQAMQIGTEFMINDPPIKEMLNVLTAYYDSGQWLADYEADERGELPFHFKRGVLSQDSVYNLLYEIKKKKDSGF